MDCDLDSLDAGEKLEDILKLPKEAGLLLSCSIITEFKLQANDLFLQHCRHLYNP